jgi:hypothetical protein
MNAAEFVDALVANVKRPTIEGVMEVLDAPSGRRPRESLMRLSRWFHSLSPDDQARLNEVVAEVVDRTMFNALCAIDGVSTIADPADVSKFRLFAVAPDGEHTLLNDPEGEFLHDLYPQASA